ncbi:hypothetical protein K491DRAFT_763534 [Lophiostoma macrostomum CBS 122681]|uniref:Uncharacterized protein n=1 Tax=Lophiostoma macrostomum CBS 122681 TaxID=1314788 RepID=A0A6A6SL44_9PLEO|nr:hypothetical protein K491DRAFT_763534 [Lophiostoma macrostomum CBS 122681]
MGLRGFPRSLFRRKPATTSSAPVNVPTATDHKAAFDSAAELHPSLTPPPSPFRASLNEKPSFDGAVALLEFVRKLPLVELSNIGIDRSSPVDRSSPINSSCAETDASSVCSGETAPSSISEDGTACLAGPASREKKGLEQFVQPSRRRYIGIKADLALESLIPSPIRAPSDPSIRFEGIKGIALHAAHGSEDCQESVLAMLEQANCRVPFHACCNCQTFGFGQYFFRAVDLQPREIRILKRAAAMLDVMLLGQGGLLSQLDVYIFRGQLFPEKGRQAMLADASFKVFLSRFFCRSIFSAEDKEKYIQLQPFYDDEETEIDANAPEPITDISLMIFMTEQEFEELPDWWDVEDSPQFNTQFRKPPPEWFIRPDSENGDWAEKDLKYQKALDDRHKRRMQGAKTLVKNEGFDSLPEYEDIEDDSRYNVRRGKLPRNAFKLPEYEDGNDGNRIEAPTSVDKAISRLMLTPSASSSIFELTALPRPPKDTESGYDSGEDEMF